MALILAINPGNSHSPTLARLARELRGCELIGAESCKVAITAINQRVPDVVLLPDRPPRGEAELFARLKAVPGGVPTLQLPPVASADPAALAKEIRKLLAGEATVPPPAPAVVSRSVATAKATAPPKPMGASPQVMAAARAAVTWIRLQRAQWAELDALAVVIEPDAHEPDESSAPITELSTVDLKEPHEPRESAELKLAASTSADATRSHEPYELHEPHEPHEHHEPYEPYEPYEPGEPAKTAARWLPRMAGLGVAVGLVVAGVWFWPQLSGTATDTAAVGTPSEPVASETAPPAIDLTLQTTTIRVTSNEPGEVLIDGTNAGQTPFDSRISIGRHTVTVRTAGGERQFTIDATMKPVRLDADFSKPQP